MQNKVEICGVNTSKLKVLKNDEMQALLLRSKAGDQEAREQLISGNLRLVLSVIQRFSNRGENADDLFQVGCIGLIKAIDNFNTDLDVRFSTYGVPMNVPCRENIRRYGEMTRKTALKEAISIIKRSELNGARENEIVEKLELCIRELPFAQWSEAAIFDACDQFIEDHRRPIVLNDFQSRMLPTHPTVKNRFGMTLKEFRDTYYPLPQKQQVLTKEAKKLVREFRKEFLRCGARTREDYDRLRDKKAPCSATILKKLGISSWSELMSQSKIKIQKSERSATAMRSTFRFKYEEELKRLG